jgi:hypothetical protein
MTKAELKLFLQTLDSLGVLDTVVIKHLGVPLTASPVALAPGTVFTLVNGSYAANTAAPSTATEVDFQ